jgi:hypothetical protein
MARDLCNMHNCGDPRDDTLRRLLRHEKLDAHDVAVRDREHKSAARRVRLDQAADIDVALGDDPVERRNDPLIGLLLLEHLDLGLLRLDGGGARIGRLRLRREVQAVGVALLLRGPALPDQDVVTRPVMRRELPIRLSLEQGCCVLCQGRLRLGDLVVELGGADHREQIARLDPRADIDVALNDVAAGPGKNVGRFKGARRRRQDHLVNVRTCLDCGDPNSRDEVALLFRGGGHFAMLRVMLCDADSQPCHQQQQRDQPQPAGARHAAADPVGRQDRGITRRGRR